MEAADLARFPRELRSARLLIRAPHPDDADVLGESLRHSRPALGFVAWGQRPFDRPWCDRFIRGCLDDMARGDYLVWHAFRLDGGGYVARIDLHSFDFEAPRAEIGYVGDSRASGGGWVREAVLAVTQAAFDFGFARVHALSDARNERALHFARGLDGFHFEGCLRAYERDPQGALADMMMFAAYNPRPV